MMGKIYEFDPVIYPTRVWAAVNPTAKAMQGKFYFLNDDDEVIDKVDLNDYRDSIATTFSVTDKKSCWKGCLVCIWQPRQTGVGVIAHESGHCTDWLCDKFGIGGFSFKEGEARQYYTQWVANCIEKVRRGKV
jgi:hypothetical protein